MTHPVSTAKSSSLAVSTLHTAHCTLHTAPVPANDLESEHTLSEYNILNTVHCTPHVYSAFFKCIPSHCKQQTFACVVGGCGGGGDGGGVGGGSDDGGCVISGGD